MEKQTGPGAETQKKGSRWKRRISGSAFSRVPLLGWLLGALLAVVVEQFFGLSLARLLGMSKVPVLFGVDVVLAKPALFPANILYMLVIYLLPLILVARFGYPLMNRAAAKLMTFPLWVSAIVHLLLLYAILAFWTEMSDYRLLIIKLMLIAVMITLSLNVVNGYMGEFSCSHPGFIALGAYAASIVTVSLFIGSNSGSAILPMGAGIFVYQLALIFGGVVASISALLVAIPSFRTRGDYLAIISLAFMFIVKSLFENLEVFGGARGYGNQPDFANLPVVFIWTVLCVFIINNFVRSTLGKALNAVRDDETAADAMTVDTSRTKMIAFLFAAFWAGVAGGLFAHVLRYVNPGTFGLQKLAEVLAMVYFGGLNSVVGSIVGAVGYNLLSEMLRPLELYKWIIIPVLLILVMIFRPTGLIAFREFDIKAMLQPKENSNKEEVDYAAASS